MMDDSGSTVVTAAATSSSEAVVKEEVEEAEVEEVEEDGVREERGSPMILFWKDCSCCITPMALTLCRISTLNHGATISSRAAFRRCTLATAVPRASSTG